MFCSSFVSIQIILLELLNSSHCFSIYTFALSISIQSFQYLLFVFALPFIILSLPFISQQFTFHLSNFLSLFIAFKRKNFKSLHTLQSSDNDFVSCFIHQFIYPFRCFCFLLFLFYLYLSVCFFALILIKLLISSVHSTFPLNILLLLFPFIPLDT